MMTDVKQNCCSTLFRFEELLPDLGTDILLRSHPLSLVQCRLVSKALMSLIDSPNFIKLQLEHSLQANSNLNLIVKNSSSSSCSYSIVELDNKNYTKLKDFECDWLSQSYYQFPLGSCNGLLLFVDTEECYVVRDIFICNPYTKISYKLPQLNFPGTHVDFPSGFGYDSITDDYKFVTGDCMYSLKSNSWKRVRRISYNGMLCLSVGLHFNGAIHWPVMKGVGPWRGSIHILSFDLRTEEFRDVPTPEAVQEGFEVGDCSKIKLWDIKGNLCVVCPGVNDAKKTDVWMMKSYGVQESWEKLFSTDDPLIGMSSTSMVHSSGDRILLNTKEHGLVLYNISSKAIEDYTNIKSVATLSIASLVSPIPPSV